MEISALYNSYTYENANTKSLPFRGKHRNTETGNQYYHTNTGSITGITSCALITGIVGILNKAKPKCALYTMLATSPLILIGVLSDKVRNDKNKKAADLIAKYDFDKISEIDKDVSLSDNNKPYKKCYSGARIGGIISAVLAVALFGFLTKKSIKTGQSIKESLKQACKEVFEETFEIDGMLWGPFLPLMVGAGLDFVANKDAKRNA